jgi:gliding motility-associated-like protein
MKGSFIIVYLWVEFIAILHGSTLRAQQTRPQIPVVSRRQIPVVSRRQISIVKNNFTNFTRKYTNRGTYWMARNKAYLSHPDANFADQYSPQTNAVEIFEKRTVDSKFYINKDNPSIVYSQRSSSPMHFKKNGQWITIDSRLQPKGALVYEASNQEDPLGFDIKRKSSYIITADGKTYFNAWKLYGENGNTETLLADADWTHYTAGDDGIAIKNIFPGIDAEMKVSRGSIKTNFIVHTNKFSFYKTLLFRDSFLNSNDGNFSFSNRSSGNGLVSSADFRVSAATVFHVKEGVMYQKEKPSSTYQFIPYYLDHNKLTLAINRDFLNAPGRIGDVVIDPQVQDVGVLLQNTITGSHSNQDCSLDTACEYDFTVPAPPGAKMIDAQFSFAFTANDPCVGQDGAFSITSGTCVSQKYLGTALGPGVQDFPNQSILMSNGANLAGCLPSPVCGLLPQNIPFSFFFYRKCHGPQGCDGSCITASKDLTITLVGRTFDSVTVTASPLLSCAGAPVTLTARGYFGVAPYNFTWPGLPQFNGDSIITVNPTTNTTYTVQVSDQCIVPVSLPVLKSINVNLFPKPLTPVLTSNSPICAGGQLILSVPPAVGTTYFISNPGSGVGGGQYASIAVFNNVTAAYAGTWIAVATDLNGCMSDTGRTTVVVNPTLSPTATITSSATNVCAGTLVTFNATAINAGTSPTYQWLLNSQKVGTNSPTYSGSSFNNNDAVSCIVSANGPCAGGFDVSNIIILHVSAPVTPTFNAIGPLCQNSTPPALPLTSKEAIAGTWNPATINTSALGTVTYTFTPATGSCANPASLIISVVGSVSPTFPAIANSYCQNAAAPALPSTSKEGITGTWSPASINTAIPGTATYTFTPTAGSCATPASLNITIVGTVAPTFPTIANSYCQNAAAPALPMVSKEGITGSWNPASINTSVPGTGTYIFTPTAGSCSIPVSLNIIIVGTVIPTFPTIANSYCQNATAPALPPVSKEGITGTWIPASINTSVPGTATYTFTPTAGSCSTPVSLNITIVGTVAPTFPTITNSYCQNTSAPALPLVSKEGITGTWSPAIINTAVPGTATYTFTPAAGSCATPASLNITIVGTVIPTFPTIANSYCQNTSAPALPLVSKEGITGTWSPASINTTVPGTATYTFIPTAGSCSTPVSLNIIIVGTIIPTFPTIANSYCQNTAAPALPLVSKEGITGTWSPAIINTSAFGTVPYTFTPTAGSCSTPVSLNITIVSTLTPTFNAIGPLCQNSSPPALPLVSKETIAGTWSPASINTSSLGTATYTFTPSAGSCATPGSLNISIVSVVTPTFPTIANSYCQNTSAPALPLVSKEGITGTWSPASINISVPGTSTYTFTPTAGGCSTPVSLNITIVGTVIPTFPTIANTYCQNTAAPALPLVSTEGITGTWSPASINMSALGTTTYIFTPTAGSCSTPVSFNITIVSSYTLIFDPIGPLCQNSTPPALPPVSKEGITGTWNPASINTSALGTVTYTFTPSAGSCANPASLNITIVGMVSPTFPTIANSYCQNTTVPALPSTSKEGITGTWSPASINTSVLGTVTYTFTPSAGICSSPVSLNINIVSTLSPTFDDIGPLCHNSTPPALPTTSKEGITGTWNPASINTSALGTVTYQFTPSSSGNCAIPTSINITIATSITPTFPTVADSYCLNDLAPALPTTSKEGINGTWNPSSISTANAGSTEYTFTPTGGQCGVPAQINITINPPPVLTMGPDVTITNGASTTLNVSVTGNIVSYQWKPSTGLNNAAIQDPVANPSSTTVYTLLVIDDNNCEASGSMTITVSGRSNISVPNAFSPNGDGINDTWIITNLSIYPGATVDVFNRYGQPVFHSENANKVWDGTYNGRSLPVGTYYYIIDLKNNEKKTAGSVTIFK